MKRYSIFLPILASVLMSCQTTPKHLSDLPSQFITIDDSVKIHYKVWNHNQPDAKMQTLCFIHGFGCDMNTWELQFEGLRDEPNLRLIFLDLPGYGQSSKPHVDYTLSYFAHAVDEVLNANNIQTAIFVGHSLGTPVCRQTMLTSLHIGGFVDIDGVYCFYDDQATPEYIESVEQFGSAFDGPQCSEVISGFVQSLSGPDTPSEITDYAMSVMPQTPEYVASSTMHNLIDRQWWPQFPMPFDVMVLCTQNSGLEPDNKQKMLSLFPQMDYTELTTCGHFIHMEQADMVNAKLKEYAARVLQNSLEDYDFAVNNLEQNYAGFPYKVTDANRAEWNSVKQQLRDSVATGEYYAPMIISDLCAWFHDYHLSCTFRQFSTRFNFSLPNYPAQMAYYNPAQVSARVNDDTWLLRFPTWMGDENYQQWVVQAVDEFRTSGCSQLIVDLRGNGGGSDGQFQPLQNLLYSQPGKTDGIMIRNSADNRNGVRNNVGDNEFWLGLMDKCEQDTAEFVTLFESDSLQMTVDPARPKRTSVIIDRLVGSSSEQLLLNLRAIAPDIKFYGRDNSLGCIDVSNVTQKKLPRGLNSLNIPVTISTRLSEGHGLIDGIGIAPDVRIELPLPDTLSNNIDSWVLWVAEKMAE